MLTGRSIRLAARNVDYVMDHLDHLDVDNLIGLMPKTVLAEYKKHAAENTLGYFTPGVRCWLETCTHPRLEMWRRDMKRYAREQYRQAIHEQVQMAEVARELYSGVKSSVRVCAVIHPVIKSWMETEHGSGVWKDKEAIADTQRHEPRLFVNN